MEQEKIEYKGMSYTVGATDYDESPRSYEEETKLCIRKHRNYTFPNELDYDFDDLDDGGMDGVELSKIMQEYRVFWIHMYEHSGIRFSLSGTGMQCRRDTSRNCGFIAIPKLKENGRDDEKKARDFAKVQIEEYSNYCNGEVYESCIEYNDGDLEHFGPYYGDDGYEEAKREAENAIDFYLSKRKQYAIKVQMKIEKEYKIFAENAQEAYDISQNKTLPSGYVEGSHDTQSIECDGKSVWNDVKF